MKNKFLFLSFIGLLLGSCTSSDQIEEQQVVEDAVTITITNSPIAIGVNDLQQDTRAVVEYEAVERAYKFYFENGDSLGIFPQDGYQIPFVSPLAVGEKQQEISIIAKGWNTKVGEKYVAYYPFVYDFKDSKKIPFSFLGQKQESVTDLSNLSKYSFRFSPQAESTTGVFNFPLKDLGCIVAIRMAAPAGTTNTTWHKVVLETGVENVFTVTGTVNLFSTDVAYGEVTPIIQQSSIALTLNDFKAGSDGYIWAYFKVPESDIPAGKNLKCWLYDTEGNAYSYTRETNTTIHFVRSEYNRMAFNLDSNDPVVTGTNTSVANMDQALNDIENAGLSVASVTVGDNNPKVDEINVPSGLATHAGSELNITFENPVTTSEVNTSNTIVITDNSSSSAPVQEYSLSQVNLKFADNTSSSEIPSLDINLPSSTVTLDRNSGAVLFNVVTTKTAKSTLVVKTGVSINTLIIEGGNVIIENGATVGEIINKAPGQSTIVNWNDGGSTEGEVNAEISGFQSGN